jgi:hypothetical protein
MARTGNLGISAKTGYTIPFSIGNTNVIAFISNSSMTFKDYCYIMYPNHPDLMLSIFKAQQ